MRRAGSRTGQGLPSLFGVATAMLAAAAILVWLLGGGAAPRPAWHLVDDHNRPVSDRSFPGRFLLIYFGYSMCAEECPLTLAAVSEAMNRLGTGAARLQPLFVTVDPSRDTPAVLHRYMAAFGAKLVGLTGSPVELDALRRRFHVRSEPGAGGAGRFEHNSVLLLVGPDGRFVRPIPADLPAGRMATLLAPYLARDAAAG